MKSWKRILLPVLIGMTVVSTAYADKIWVASTSGKDPAAEAELLSYFVTTKAAAGVDIKSDAISNLVYERTAKNNCFNSLTELTSEPFLKAFQVEWKMSFRKKYRLTAETVSWDVFKAVGRQFGGFEICNQEENKIILQLVKDKQQVVTLQNQAQQLADKPMTPANVAELDAIEAMIKDQQSKVDGHTTTLSAHAGLIEGQRKKIENLETGLNDVVTRVGKLEGRVGPIETTANSNSQEIGKINSTLTQVGADSAAAKAAAEEAKRKAEKVDAEMNPPGQPSLKEIVDGFVKQFNDIWSRIGQLDLWAVVGVVLALIGIGLCVFLFFNKSKKEKEEKMPKGMRAAPAGRSADDALNFKPEDKAS